MRRPVQDTRRLSRPVFGKPSLFGRGNDLVLSSDRQNIPSSAMKVGRPTKRRKKLVRDVSQIQVQGGVAEPRPGVEKRLESKKLKREMILGGWLVSGEESRNMVRIHVSVRQ